MYDLVSLGEMMLRLSPPGQERLRQARNLVVRACGAQFNVAANLALLGKRTAFLTKLPDNDLGYLARSASMGYGVDMSHAIMTPDNKMGMVFVDFAVEPRSAAHLYDRQGSAASTTSPGDFEWSTVLKGSRLAYTDGIFLGLSTTCRDASLEFISAARASGCTICFDVNYREMIWTPPEAERAFRQVLPCVDILVTNRHVSESVFGYSGSDERIASRYREDFGCKTVCLTFRDMSGKRGEWRSIALHEDRLLCGKTRQFEVVDRFGTGDAFFAGMLYGHLEGDLQCGLDFGNAMCALAHTVDGDVTDISAREVWNVLRNGYDARVKR